MSKQVSSVETRWFLKAGMVVISIVVFLVVIEIILRNSIEYMPLKYQKYLPRDVKILAQNTKDALVPESYVALLGDSYAAGWGDWYRERLDEASLGNPPFHSADTIHRQTGLNVLTFARPGQGSFDGIAYFPRLYLRRLLSRGFALPDPSVIVIYFYEGNDLNDNLQFWDRYWGRDDLLTPVDVEGLIQKISAGELRGEGAVTAYLRGLEFIHRLYVAKFLYVLATDTANLLLQIIDQESATDEDQPNSMSVRIGSDVLRVPGPVETPPVQLTDFEVTRAVNVFESSSRYLMKQYPNSQIFIVYVPSPIMSYQLESESVPVPLPDGSVQEYPVSTVETVSDRVCEHIADVAFRLRATFLDIRPPIRTAGQAQLIHGPNDWQHFNEVGYKVLGSTVGRYLTIIFNGLQKDGKYRPVTETPMAKSRCAQIGKHDREAAALRPELSASPTYWHSIEGLRQVAKTALISRHSGSWE